MQMNISDITSAFCQSLRLLCSRGADQGATSKLQELTNALDDLAAYASAECSRSLEPVGEDAEGKWWERCTPGFDAKAMRLTSVVMALLDYDSSQKELAVSCIVEADVAVHRVECPKCGDNMQFMPDPTDMLFVCDCGTRGIIEPGPSRLCPEPTTNEEDELP